MLQIAGAVASYTNWADLHLSPVALDLKFFQLRWYSIAYLAGILLGWWYLTKLLDGPGAPLARRHADDLIPYATLGIIVGGRLGYALFYKPELLTDPAQLIRLWEGGMSLHGGLAGTIIAIWLFCRKHQLNMLRVCDYIACVTPLGLLFGRLANFVNGELWGRPATVPWAMVFPQSGTLEPRHPSQLYEAGLEGVVMLAILSALFWRTDARYQPGRLVGTGLVLYGIFRALLERVRQPDAGLEHLSWGLTMGQTLSLPMVLLGLYLVVTSARRRVRVEPFAGTAAVS